jgi:hypothetical protein
VSKKHCHPEFFTRCVQRESIQKITKFHRLLIDDLHVGMLFSPLTISPAQSARGKDKSAFRATIVFNIVLILVKIKVKTIMKK